MNIAEASGISKRKTSGRCRLIYPKEIRHLVLDRERNNVDHFCGRVVNELGRTSLPGLEGLDDGTVGGDVYFYGNLVPEAFGVTLAENPLDVIADNLHHLRVRREPLMARRVKQAVSQRVVTTAHGIRQQVLQFFVALDILFKEWLS